jgi:hypothetical protein
MRFVLLTCFLFTGCHTDRFGVMGTRWMLDHWERARHNGSLACEHVFASNTRASPFDVGCHYDVKYTTCLCRVSSGTRFEEPIFPLVGDDQYVFEAGSYMTLPDGLSWPPNERFERAKAGVSEITHAVEAGQ